MQISKGVDDLNDIKFSSIFCEFPFLFKVLVEFTSSCKMHNKVNSMFCLKHKADLH